MQASAPSSLAGSGAGVYVGASSVDYGARFFADPSSADVHMMTGNTLSIIANRLSYHLDLHGPSFTVDTACSSSLVALSLAADAIRSGAVDTAIVGGVNLLLSPFSFVGFSRASMLSPTGRCRPFDAAADGYVRAEGAIVLVLRSLDAARKARNRIHGTLAGSGVGQDGRTTGLSPAVGRLAAPAAGAGVRRVRHRSLRARLRRGAWHGHQGRRSRWKRMRWARRWPSGARSRCRSAR